jgi:hypothetical protein
MDMGEEPDRLHQLDKDIDRIGKEDPNKVLDDIHSRYLQMSSAAQNSDPNDLARWPLWQLAQDLQRQATVYTNIIEQLKSGTAASEVKARFEDTLSLIPDDTLPNPKRHEAIERAFKKVQHYGTSMVLYVKKFGNDLLAKELEVGTEHTATIQVQIGLTGPSITLGTEYTKVGAGTLKLPQ